MDRRFRFGVIAAPHGSGRGWGDLARRVEGLGYATLLMPDGLQLLAPMPAGAVAATATSTLRVGTFVLASTVRPPRTAAWEAASLTALTDGRFDFGIGTGNPWMNRSAVEEIGMPETTPAQRLQQVRRTIEHLRELETDRRTPVMIAAGGPRARALSGEVADIVTLAHGTGADRATVARLVTEVEDAAGDRAGQIEYLMNVPVVGDAMPPGMDRILGTDVASLVAADSLFVLHGTPREMADEIERRREQIGYSLVAVNQMVLEEFAPVVELLAGR